MFQLCPPREDVAALNRPSPTQPRGPGIVLQTAIGQKSKLDADIPLTKKLFDEVAARRGDELPQGVNGLTCPTFQIPAIENNGGFAGLSNQSSGVSRLRSLGDSLERVTLPPEMAADDAPGLMPRARQWADHASRRELKAFALAAYEAMSEPDQSAFLDHILPGRRGQ